MCIFRLLDFILLVLTNPLFPYICSPVFAVSVTRVMFQPTMKRAAQTLMNVLLTMVDVLRFVLILTVVICVSAVLDTMPLTLSEYKNSLSLIFFSDPMLILN